MHNNNVMMNHNQMTNYKNASKPPKR